MKKTIKRPDPEKDMQLTNALYKQDKARAQKLYAELKPTLTQGARLEIERQIAAMKPAKTAAKSSKK